MIIALLATAGIFYSGTATGRVYPWMLVVLFVSMSALVVLVMLGGSAGGVIGGGLMIAVAYRFHLNYITTPIGASPQRQPRTMDRIVETGIVDIGSGFYAEAPIHFIYVAIYTGLSGFPAHDAILFYSLLNSAVLLLVSIGLLRLIGVKDARALALVALLALVTTEGIRRSYWVVPQVTATLVWWCALLVLVKHVQRPSKALFAVLALFAATLAFTHKLPLAVLAAVLLVLLVLLVADVITWDSSEWFTPLYQVGSMLSFISVLVAAQLVYVGGLIGQVTRRIGRLFAGESGAVRGGTDEGGPEAAVEALPGIIANFYEYPSAFVLFVERGHGVWLLLASGAAWAYLFFALRDERDRSPTLVLLAVAATGVALMAMGVVAITGMNPTRPLFLIEPVLVVLIVGAVWNLAGRLPNRTGTIGSVTIVLVVLLVASQVFAASAAPDYANTPQYYADVPEAQAEATFCEYSTGDIYVDEHYNRFADIDRGSCSDFEGFGTSSDNELFNNEIAPETHRTVAFRHDTDVYLGQHDRWRLTWDPNEELSTEYHRVYHNGGVSIFHSPV